MRNTYELCCAVRERKFLNRVTLPRIAMEQGNCRCERFQYEFTRASHDDDDNRIYHSAYSSLFFFLHLRADK